MELVRKILMTIHDLDGGYVTERLAIDGYTNEQIGYHCFLLGQAGLINAVDNSSVSSTSPSALPQNLTWHGHEFIENAKNENVWLQTKQAVSKMGEVSFSVWANVLSQIVINNLNINS